MYAHMHARMYTHMHTCGVHVHVSVTLLIPQAGGHAADSGLTPSAGKTPRRTGSGSQTNELSARIDQLTAVLVTFSVHVHRGNPFNQDANLIPISVPFHTYVHLHVYTQFFCLDSLCLTDC